MIGGARGAPGGGGAATDTYEDVSCDEGTVSSQSLKSYWRMRGERRAKGGIRV